MNPNRIVPLLIAAVLNVATLLGSRNCRARSISAATKDSPSRRWTSTASRPASKWHRRFSNRTTATAGSPAKRTIISASNARAHGPEPRSRTTTTRRANAFRKYASVEDSDRVPLRVFGPFRTLSGPVQARPAGTIKDGPTGSSRPAMRPNPQYAELLIKIIEDNRLYLLDEGRDIDPQIMGNRPDKQALIAEEIPHAAPADIVDIDNYSVSVQGRKGRPHGLPEQRQPVRRAPRGRNAFVRCGRIRTRARKSWPSTTTSMPARSPVPAIWSTSGRKTSAAKTAS